MTPLEQNLMRLLQSQSEQTTHSFQHLIDSLKVTQEAEMQEQSCVLRVLANDCEQLLKDQARHYQSKVTRQAENLEERISAQQHRLDQALAEWQVQSQALRKLLDRHSVQSNKVASSVSKQHSKLEKGLIHLGQQLRLLTKSVDSLTGRLSDLERWAKD